jgi:N-acetylgalactosamine-6-sulfatase
MNRRTALKSLSGLPLSFSSIARPAHAPTQRPLNIVFILADDLGYGDLGSYGSADIRTPNIDRIGRQGARFSQYYANAPECTPTRAALLTGEYQQRFGGLECAIGIGDVGRYDEAIWLQKRGELGLPISAVTLPRILKGSGYDTALIGKWHLGYLPEFSPNRHGFEEFFGIIGGNADYFKHTEASNLACFYHNDKPVQEDGYMTDLFTTHAIQWLKQRSKDPFFLYLAYTCPHLPLQGPEDRDKPPADHSRAVYRNMIERMDQGVGEVLAQLDHMGAAENTLIVFASDNGAIRVGNNTPFRGFKSSVWEGGIRMPCMARLPGVIPRGSSVTQVALGMDWLPTILDAAGIPLPPGKKTDGVSIFPILKQEKAPFDRTVFWRYKRLEEKKNFTTLHPIPAKRETCCRNGLKSLAT